MRDLFVSFSVFLFFLFVQSYAVSAETQRLCRDLAIGECKNFDLSKKNTETNKSMNYKLCRKNEKTYQINLNIWFFEDTYNKNKLLDEAQIKKDILNPSHKNYTVNRKWHEKVRACLNSQKEKLSDPLGRRLEFKFYFHKYRGISDPSPILIEINSNNNRSYDTVFTKHISCGTIIHEMFHHAGLIDEYSIYDKLLHKKTIEKKSCRAIGDVRSIMRDARALGSSYDIEYTLCKCKRARPNDLSRCAFHLNKSNETVKKLIYKHYINYLHGSNVSDFSYKNVTENLITIPKKKGINQCPKGFKTLVKRAKFEGYKNLGTSLSALSEWFIDRYHLPANEGIYDNNKQGFLYLLIPTKIERIPQKPGLMPAHVNAIIYPNCGLRNKKYYQCARMSYGKSCSKFKACQNRGGCKLCKKEGAWTSEKAINNDVTNNQINMYMGNTGNQLVEEEHPAAGCYGFTISETANCN